MTEAEWLASDDPWDFLSAPQMWDKHPDRRWRLFALACLEPFRQHLSDKRFDKVFDALATDAKGECPPEEFLRAESLASEIAKEIADDASEQRTYYLQRALTEAIVDAMGPSGCYEPILSSRCITAAAYLTPDEPQEVSHQREELRQVALIRDIFGNPFRPVTREPAWLTSDVLALARGIYDDKAFDRMPILADALQDAGCANEEVLSHCRDASLTHVRGCWVLDLLLGKQ